ncbi:MAG: hypothetical protein K2G70_01940 [Turicibacter sp.]|nr:hypothetical protein [Turicibacter sp.]
MKRKQPSNRRQSPSPKNKSRLTDPSKESMNDIFGVLIEQVDQMQSMINQIPLPSSSNPKEINEERRYTPLNEFDSILTEMRFQNSDVSTASSNTESRLNQTGGGAANSGQSSAAIAHRTSFDYTPPPSPKRNYGFTNSEFFAFIGSLDPVEYILVITIIAIIIGVELNVFERQIVGGALVDIGVTLGNMVEQELFRQARENESRSRQRDEAEQTDFDNLYNGIDQLQAQIDELKQLLKNN